MASTFFGLDIAVSGMNTYMTALNLSAHNISNIATKGYTKQSVVQSATNPISSGSSYGMLGTGVKVTEIEQNRNAYFDKKYWYNNSISGEYSTKEYYLSCIEDYIYSADSKTGGVSKSLDNLFNSMKSLTTDASDTTIRTEVVSYAATFAMYVNEQADSLQTLQKEANFEIKTVVSQINSIGEKIASLNKQINTLEVYGGTANDLRDARNVLLDELSQYVNVSVTETEATDGISGNQYVLRIAGSILVDTYSCRQLQVVPSETKDNQNDVEGLYDIEWTDDQAFNIRNTSLGGSLQALLECRDGNNAAGFASKIDSVQTSAIGVTTVQVKDANIQDMMLLNIPETKGILTIGSYEFEYESFDASMAADGTYTYTFTLKGEQSVAKKAILDTAVTEQKSVEIGDSIAYKGIPYYMAQLNEFVRTFSTAFNQVHNTGFDLNQEQGIDLFNGKTTTSGDNYKFAELGKDGTAIANYSFTSLVSADATGTYVGSYYNMTALNFCIHKEVEEDVNKLACSSDPTAGVEQSLNLSKLINVKTDSTLFQQGNASSFLQTMVSSVGVDAKAAVTFSTSQKNILKAIENRRFSVSGVDEDEEAADLIKFQNLLLFQYKVLSVMDEVYEKLINGTAV